VKRKLVSIIIGSLLCLALLVPLIPVQPAQSAEVTLEVLNPKGNIEPLKLQYLAERVDTLAGKKIYLYFYSKDAGTDGLNMRGSIVNLLQEKYGTYNAATNPNGVNCITALNKSGVDYHDSIENYDLMARQCDVAILGVAN
jgi:hypothetical protein